MNKVKLFTNQILLRLLKTTIDISYLGQLIINNQLKKFSL